MNLAVLPADRADLISERIELIRTRKYSPSPKQRCVLLHEEAIEKPKAENFKKMLRRKLITTQSRLSVLNNFKNR